MKKIALLFPGQGSQYIGMGRKLCEKFSIARETFEEAGDVLKLDMKKLCFEGNLSELGRLDKMLPAILTCSVAAFRVFMQTVDVMPRFMAGHSLGEYSALTCCGAVKLSDALNIVRLRAILASDIAEKKGGMMTVVNGIEDAAVEKLCREASNEHETVCIACYNSPTQVVVAGHQNAVIRVEDRIMDIEGQVTPLFNSAPFHSPLMQPTVEVLKEEVLKYRFDGMLCPVISNVSSLPYNSPEEIVRNLLLQLTHPVQWRSTMEYLEQQGIEAVVEMGSQSVLAGLTGGNCSSMTTAAFCEPEDVEKITALISLARGEINRSRAKLKKNEASGLIARCLCIAASTPNCNWNEEEYENGVVKPYKRLCEIKDDLDTGNSGVSAEMVTEAVEMLKSILSTKKVVEEEIAGYIKEISYRRGLLL